MKFAALVFLAFVARGYAQLAPPNESGVSMGHLHINTADVAAQKKFWIDILGAKPVKLGANNEGAEMEGAIVLFRAAKPSGPSDGSTVGHVGVLVRSLDEYLPKLNAAGLKYTKNTNGRQLMIESPDGVRVELTADASMTGPLRFHHIHFYTEDPVAIQSWYAEKFGASYGKRAQWEAGDVPGANLTYAKISDAVAPTNGRALDHIGFEVRNLEAFAKKLADSGVKIDTPYRKLPSGLAILFITDPWGTKVELTEGLEKAVAQTSAGLLRQ